MKNLILLFLFAAIFSPLKLYSQENDHPIDKQLSACYEKNPSTAGMVNCINEAFEKWDALLNKCYKLLIAKLDEESAKALKSAESEWIAYKEKEINFIDKMYSTKEGTMYIPMRAYSIMNITKTRALELEGYCSDNDISTK
ncbi:MAG: DUF1311 domain-containing protein [Ignavibacteriae bacterium]|nr:DUF1311 domain-containing protein [Ignavibacteriota bacterium]